MDRLHIATVYRTAYDAWHLSYEMGHEQKAGMGHGHTLLQPGALGL